MPQAPTFDIQDYRDFENLEFYARQVVEGFITGLHKSPFHGFSVEFAEHRSYNPGESTRNIDWKLYGRTDRLYTKRYEEETNLRCHLVLDTSGSMHYPLERLNQAQKPNKILFSSIAILALSHLFRKQRDAVGLSLFGTQDLITNAKSTYQHLKMINTELFKALHSYQQPQSNAVSLSAQLHFMAQKINKRSLVLIFTDLFEAIENPTDLYDALQHLKHQKHEVVLFWTTDKSTELDFDFEARPYRFVDMESGAKIRLNPQELAEAYRQKAKDFEQEMKTRMLQYKIDWVPVDVSEGYQAILQKYLLKRQRMRG
jgi:uncharacterized protein (DUF58 family)